LKRSHGLVEAKLGVSEGRAALALGLGLLGMVVPSRPPSVASLRAEAQQLLEKLRAAQLRHKEQSGSFLACGPTPRHVPQAPTAWPDEPCFVALGFSPGDQARFQLTASVT